MRGLYLLGLIALALQGGTASAQDIFVDQSISFTLKPAIRRSPLLEARRTSPDYGWIGAIRPLPGDEPDHVVALRLQRQSRRLIGAQADILPAMGASRYDHRPRSRTRMLSVEDHFTLSDQVAMTLGFAGLKVSNRNANVTIGSDDDRLRARDWFLPKAVVHYRPTSAITLSMDYEESMRAYGDTGFTGPLGLSRPDFEALRRSLRPEKSRVASIGGQWSGGDMIVTTSLYRADIRNGLSFADRAYLPTNIGSARLLGVKMMARHQLTPHLDWSVRYQQAAVDTMTGRSVQEREMALAAAWTSGAWRVAAQGSRTGRAALAALGTQQSPLRAEGSIEYTPVQQGRQRLRLAARFINPSRLVSIGLSGPTAMGSLHSVDQTRAVMFSADMGW
ncbi:TonB-dependent receptor [Sphingobium sp. AS12]|uniref:TonB-dependent receptor domain-containing protein n=1 Tax=Sphingobium sp. AS12 TaxID=2849495 RepID=UPI001C31C7B7|nr:TonB-dependent receptor [Sphingobium sp. AS12]MBV2148958.1 TonB-dependent receptor [Sphingobium sp. AS12]